MKHLTIFILTLSLISTKLNAQMSISFGDNPNTVLNAVKFVTNQTNSAHSEISAYYKVMYENGNPVEILFVKKNLSNLYGTLTHYFTAKERLIFTNSKLSKKLVEIPEKSLSEVKTAIGKSNQFNFIDNYIFSEDYKSVYSVYLNSEKVTTVQSLPTLFQKFPTKVQEQLDSIFVERMYQTAIEAQQEEKQTVNDTIQETKIEMVKIAKNAQFTGGEKALYKYISSNIEIPKDASEWSGKVMVGFTIEKDGEITNIKVNNDRSNDDYLPISLNGAIMRMFKNMPKWKPAELSDGTPTTSTMQIPLNF